MFAVLQSFNHSNKILFKKDESKLSINMKDNAFSQFFFIYENKEYSNNKCYLQKKKILLLIQR